MNIFIKKISKRFFTKFILVLFCIVIFDFLCYANSPILYDYEKDVPLDLDKVYATSILSNVISSKNVTDIIMFGNYEQDGNSLNGKEAIEWIILEKNNGIATLITKKILDCKPFNKEHKLVYWENSTIRDYIKNYMYNNMFTASEKACIKETENYNFINPYTGEFSGNPTKDFIYLPGIEDIYKYFYNVNLINEKDKYDELRKTNPIRIAEGTSYAINNGLRVGGSNMNIMAGNYFLRTIGLNSHRAWYRDVEADYFVSYIREDGSLNEKGTANNSIDDGIRLMCQVYY